MKIRSLVMFVAGLLLLFGCDHHHEEREPVAIGPHGGVMLQTEDAGVQVEYVHLPAEQRVVLHVADGEMRPLEAVAPPVINIVANGEPRQLEAEPLPDQPGAFTATDEAFRGEDFRARANIEVGQRVFQVELVEPEGHHHHH